MTAIPKLPSVQHLIFEAPLYASYHIDPSSSVLEALYRVSGRISRIDGHCPYCHRASTFSVFGQSLPVGFIWNDLEDRVAYDEISAVCVRDDAHKMRIFFHKNKLSVEKVGQHPSLATVSNDEVSPYRRHMNAKDGAEFHKAIGLAAHGVGVGSFVYLRRVFERLIYRRFAEFKIQEGWNDEEFNRLRMEEKVLFLKEHLPKFLVENRRVYSILSLGIHELEEEACLAYFEALKHAVIIILEDDKKTREELERRQAFAKALAQFEIPDRQEPEDREKEE